MADKILRDACKLLGVEEISTHSFRRTARAQMEERGDTSLELFKKSLVTATWGSCSVISEVTPEQKRKAVSVIGF